MTLLNVDRLNIALAGDGKKLVEDVSFSIKRGEMLALVGESGSGKSLTAMSIMQLLNKGFHATGSISYNDQELNGASDSVMRTLRGSRISMIFQEPMTALNPLHTIGRQIDEMMRVQANPRRRPGSTSQRNDSQLSHGDADPGLRRGLLLDQVGLPHFCDRLDAYPHQLSGGERQRVMIAMAIANHPDLLIADEPTTAVDVTIQAKILTLLKALQQEMGMAMLFITHDLTLVEKLADRVAVMQQGRLVEIGKVMDVFAAPKHAYTQKLLASKPTGSAVPLPVRAETILQADGVSVKFPIKRGILKRTVGYNVAVNDISFDLRAGETLGVVGESGSGKTTLAFALLRMLRAEGKIVFLGKDISTWHGRELRTLRQHMQLVFQDPYGSLNPRMTVGQIVREGLQIHDVKMRGCGDAMKESQSADRRIITPPHLHIENILTEVGLDPDMAERYPHEFSGGQRQRISIARAMILQPKLVILDEPTSALDLTVQTQILALLKEFQQRLGLSYIFISHDLRVVRAIAHRLLVMRGGEVVEHGETSRIFRQPTSEYTTELLKAAYLLE